MGRHPWADTPLGRHPVGGPPGRHPQADTPTPGRHPPAQCRLGYGQQAGGTHPTGMHSCLDQCSMSLFQCMYVTFVK